jgi:hypothetical protein
LERILGEDPSFSMLYAGAARDMGFELPEQHSQADSLLPKEIVHAMLEGKPHVTTSWQTVERTKEFMTQENSMEWWAAYTLQVPGCGHLMMQDFIQRILDELQPEAENSNKEMKGDLAGVK